MNIVRTAAICALLTFSASTAVAAKKSSEKSSDTAVHHGRASAKSGKKHSKAHHKRSKAKSADAKPSDDKAGDDKTSEPNP